MRTSRRGTLTAALVASLLVGIVIGGSRNASDGSISASSAAYVTAAKPATTVSNRTLPPTTYTILSAWVTDPQTGGNKWRKVRIMNSCFIETRSDETYTGVWVSTLTPTSC